MHLLCLSGLDSPTLSFGTKQTLRSCQSMSALGDVAEVAQTIVLMVESLPVGAAARSPAGAALAMPVASVQFRVSQAARRGVIRIMATPKSTSPPLPVAIPPFTLCAK